MLSRYILDAFGSRKYPVTGSCCHGMDWAHLAVVRIPVAESYHYRIYMTARAKISYLYYVTICNLADSLPHF